MSCQIFFIKLRAIQLTQASNHKLIRKHGFFDLLGCDFMLSEDNRLYLLEINTNPALSLGMRGLTLFD